MPLPFLFIRKHIPINQKNVYAAGGFIMENAYSEISLENVGMTYATEKSSLKAQLF